MSIDEIREPSGITRGRLSEVYKVVTSSGPKRQFVWMRHREEVKSDWNKWREVTDHLTTVYTVSWSQQSDSNIL